MEIELLHSNVEILAVLAATVSSMVLGFIYYNPMVAGKQWMRLVGVSEEDTKKGSMLPMLITVVLSFFAFSVLAIVWSYVDGLNDWGAYESALVASLLIWIPAFYATAMNNAYSQRDPMLTLIDTGYMLMNLVIGGLLIAVIS